MATTRERVTEPTSDRVVTVSESRRRLAAGIGLSALSGVLAVLAFEDYHIAPLIWIAFVPMLVAQHRVLPRKWSGLGPAIAIGIMFQGYLGPGISAAAEDVAWYFSLYGVFIGLFVAALTWRSRAFQERTGYRWFVLSGPVCWVALEFLRSVQTEALGGTWGFVAYTQYHRPSLLQPVSIFGIHAVNLLIFLVNWALARAALSVLDARRGPVDGREPLALRPARVAAGAVAGVLVIWSVASLAMMREPAASVRVAAVQPGTLNDADHRTELSRDVAQTRAAAAQGAKLVVWREGGLSFDPRSNPDVAKAASDNGVYLVAGWRVKTAKGALNEAAAYDPSGAFLGTYGKSHPGTFAGDYSDRRGDYVIYAAPFGRFGTIICFDLDYTDSARKTARLGANLLAVPSSDNPGIAQKHYSHLVFRAIETRLTMIKADRAFDSAIIDPYGRIIESFVSKPGAASTVVADVPIGGGKTPYTRFGEWFGWLSVAGLAFFIGLSHRARRRAKRG